MTFIFFMLPQQATILFIDLSPREIPQYGPLTKNKTKKSKLV